MSRPEIEVPEFVVAALGDDTNGPAASRAGKPPDTAADPEAYGAVTLRSTEFALGRLPELLDPVAVVPASLDRLIEEVSELPMRYAPLFDRLGELWDLPELDVRAVLASSKDARAWRRPPLAGLEIMSVRGGPKTVGADVYLARFAPGSTFPAHRHEGAEDVLLLEGSYTDSGGRVYESGDVHHMAAGSQHAFTIAPDEPCIAAAVHHGIRFSSPWLRVLAKFFG